MPAAGVPQEICLQSLQEALEESGVELARERHVVACLSGTQFACFTSTTVQILTQMLSACCGVTVGHSIYLLYWYKSTHTDAATALHQRLLALLVHEYTY